MIERVAVDDERAEIAQGLKRGGLAAARAAGDADHLHAVNERVGNLILPKRAGAKYLIRRGAHVDDGGLAPDAALAAVYHGVYLPVEVFKHLLRVLRAFRTGGIRRGRGEGKLCTTERLKRQRMVWTAQADRRAPGADYVRHGGLRAQDNRERAGPEPSGKQLRLRGHVLAVFVHRGGVRDHERQRLNCRAALHVVYPPHGAFIQPAARKAIHRFRRHGDKAAVSYYVRRGGHIVLQD